MIRVYEENLMSNDALGFTKICANTLCFNGGAERDYRIMLNDEVQGTVRLKTKFTDPTAQANFEKLNAGDFKAMAVAVPESTGLGISLKHDVRKGAYGQQGFVMDMVPGVETEVKCCLTDQRLDTKFTTDYAADG